MAIMKLGRNELRLGPNQAGFSNWRGFRSKTELYLCLKPMFLEQKNAVKGIIR
jgi:hypothetical protein